MELTLQPNLLLFLTGLGVMGFYAKRKSRKAALANLIAAGRMHVTSRSMRIRHGRVLIDQQANDAHSKPCSLTGIAP